ncbi:hypothetical protein [Streptomyces sp. CC77]|uniref:hypothetical protein n=1 Tax=Streptomyces sp. CC77 TaxID=1906739 RepID=UPI0008DE6847|nr:hypothetical protein [Streptomyces sp. CC77]OII68252.1 hypothetical protein BJP39_00355 [Streptomyces sp. CC77]
MTTYRSRALAVRARIGDLVRDGPEPGSWIYTDRRGEVAILRPFYAGGGATRTARHPQDLRVVKTREELRLECPLWV